MLLLEIIGAFSSLLANSFTLSSKLKFVYISVSFLSFDIKEWITENDLLVHWSKVSKIIGTITDC